MDARTLRKRLIDPSPGSRYICRKCGDPLPNESIEYSRRRAVCACGKKNYLPSTSEAIDLSSEDLDTMPSGAWRSPDFGGERIGASCASVRDFLLALGLATFWNGIAGFFTLAAWGSAYMHFTGTQTLFQGWQISRDLPMEPGLTVFAVLFLIPFQLIGLAMGWAVLMALGGRAEMLIAGDRSWIENRFGVLAFKTRFDVAQVRHVYLLTTRDDDGRREHASTIEIWFEGLKKPGKLSRERIGVPKSRRRWLAAAWRHALLGTPAGR